MIFVPQECKIINTDAHLTKLVLQIVNRHYMKVRFMFII